MFFWFPTLIISYTLKGIILIKKSCLLLGLHFSWIYEHFLPFWIFRDLRDVGRAIASENWHQKVVDSISFLHDSHYQIPCLIHHEGWCEVSRVMQKSLEVWHMMLPEDTAQSSLFFQNTRVLMQRGIQCRVGGSAVIVFEIRIYMNLFSNFPKSWSKCLHCWIHGGRRFPCIIVWERYP